MAEDTSAAAIAEISHGPSKFDVFMEKNQKLLIIVALVAVIAVVTAIVFSGLGNIANQEAGSKLYNAEGEEQLREAIKDAPQNTQATGLYLLSQEQLLTDADAACETLKKIISDYPNEAITEQAKLSLALATLKSGNVSEAKQSLENIVADSSTQETKPFAVLALADIARQAGNPERTKELYTQAAEQSKFVRLKTISQDAQNVANVQAPKLVVKEITPPESTPSETPTNP